MKIGELIKSITFRLQEAGIQSPDAEARLIVSSLLHFDFSELIIKSDEVVESDITEKVSGIVEERLTNRPIQYILGETEFFGVNLKVGEGVLIPRPETEVLVEKVLELYSGNGDVLDLCTGSGAIPLALQAEMKSSCEIYGVDISDDALFYAKKNREQYATKFPERPVRILEGDLFEPVPKGKKFAVITTNPPYVTEDEYSVLPQNVKHFEPKLALTADNEGLAIIQRIAEFAPSYLLDDGFLICEIGWQQGEAAKMIFAKYFRTAEVVKDYTGRDRFILAYK